MKILWLVALLAIATTSTSAQENLSPYVLRLDSALDAIVSSDAKVEHLVGNFKFLEGPVWVRSGNYLIFSDLADNSIFKWDPKSGSASVFLKPSGFTGSDPTSAGREVHNGKTNVLAYGSNGIAVDRQGRVVFNAAGDRAVVQMEKDGRRTVLADSYAGAPLNSPNDIVVKKDGTIYFTAPGQSVHKLFHLKNARLTPLANDMRVPNGLAFSPNEKILYVTDTIKKNVMQFDVFPNGIASTGRLFVDMSSESGNGEPDGIKVDVEGNVYCTGVGGIWVLSPEGRHLGTLVFPEEPANLAFGDGDGRTLYVTARTGLYRIRMKIPGVHP